MDPLQFAYRPNRSTDDAISQVLHSSLSHIDSKTVNYVRLLFIDYSSAFNTIVPIKLAVNVTIHRSVRSFLFVVFVSLSLWQRSLLGQCWSADELITQTPEAHQDCYLCGVFALALCQIIWRAHLWFCCSSPVCSQLPVSVQFLFWWLAFPLWIPEVCISNHCPAHCSLLAVKACSLYRRLTILTVLFIHSLPCSINCFLHLLLDSEFTSWQLNSQTSA